MVPFGMTELRGWFFLVVSLVFLSMICALAVLSAYMQPRRWSERQKRLLV